MFGSNQTSVIQKPLKDANFLSIYVFVNNNYVYDMCLHARCSRCVKTWQSSYGSCETENKQCSSCILTTKLLTQANYYDIFLVLVSFWFLKTSSLCTNHNNKVLKLVWNCCLILQLLLLKPFRFLPQSTLTQTPLFQLVEHFLIKI
jgi:hypothetical protein